MKSINSVPNLLATDAGINDERVADALAVMPSEQENLPDTTIPPRRSLQHRIVLSFTVLMLVVQAAIYVAVSHEVRVAAAGDVENEFVAASRVFNKTLDYQEDRLRQRASFVAGDPAFIEAVSSHRQARIVDVLRDHGTRIRADVTMLIGADGRIVADSRVPDQEPGATPFASLVVKSSIRGTATLIVPLDGTIYQFVAVPVRAPAVIAWVVMGFAINDTGARDLNTLTALQVSFLTRRGTGPWRVAGSTLPANARAALPAAVGPLSLDRPDSVPLVLPTATYQSLFRSLSGSGDEQVAVLLQRPRVEGATEIEAVTRDLLIASGAALLISIICSVLIARNITRPLRRLALFARRIAQGEYDTPVDIHRDDEIGDLASAFEDMRTRVTHRERRILDLAYRDALTDLPNRILFADRLQQAIAVARRMHRPLSVIMMDLDRFKEVNESLGHQGGDQLLVEVSRRLQDVIRRRSDTLARMGGDEFAVLLPTEDTREVMSVVRKMQQSLEAPIAIAGAMVDARISIGIATYPDHGEDLITLLRHADSAMYIAKRNGTGYASFDPRYASDSRERLSLMSELRQAVEHDELVAFYQPKIDLVHPNALSVEALVRWEHKTRGFVPPDQFIPFAEQTGYISKITEWMLNRVLKQMRRWHEEGLEIHVAVNISTRDVMNPHFPTTLATLIERYRCKAQWLTLEITETAIVDDPAQAQANIDRLHAQGCRISIDDFGTGYSSLAYLKRLRVDELKVDRSFVMGMTTDPSDVVIVRSTIDLGHNMGLRVTAEGVETEAALKQLRAMGCDMAQGYLFSRPVGAAELEAWIAASPWVAGRRIEVPVLAAAS
jgi:diguanylate cyclase (GGDEF)-like protein